MSHQDMLGSLKRVLDGVSQKYLGSLIDLSHKLRTPSRDFWFEALKKFLRLEDPFNRLSRNLKVVTYGMDPRDLLLFIERRGKKVSPFAREVIRTSLFAPAPIQEYDVVIIPEEEFFLDDEHAHQEFVEEALRRGFRIPPPDIALILCRDHYDEEFLLMGFNTITVMHEPLRGPDGKTYRLRFNMDDTEGAPTDCLLGVSPTDSTDEEGKMGGMKAMAVAFLAPSKN